MTTDGGGWTLAFSSTQVDGASEEVGTQTPNPQQATLTPTGPQVRPLLEPAWNPAAHARSASLPPSKSWTVFAFW
jgi:hypothetical protein